MRLHAPTLIYTSYIDVDNCIKISLVQNKYEYQHYIMRIMNGRMRNNACGANVMEPTFDFLLGD